MAGCALAFAFKVRGMRVGVMKPVQTGSNEPVDAASLVAAGSSNLALQTVSPYVYRTTLAPAAAAESENAAPPDYARIVELFTAISANTDVVIVEDSEGLAAPIDWGHDFAALARELQMELILTVANRPGFIAGAAAALEYAAHRSIATRGFIMNALDRDASATVNRDSEFVARATGVKCLGVVRFKEPLGLGIVERLL